MRAWRLGERIVRTDVDMDLSAHHHVEQVIGRFNERLAGCRVVAEARMRDIERAEPTEPARRHRVGIAGRLAKGREYPAAAQAAQRILERSLADRIVDDRHAVAASERAHALDDIVLAEHQGMIAAMCARDRRLLVAADGADHGRAKMLRPLADDLADATGGGMNEDAVAR